MALLLTALLPQLGISAPLVSETPARIPQICDISARYAAERTGVPLDVLRAVSRVETGRQSDGVLAPWPWTVNMEGTGKWFPDRQSARAYAFDSFKAGARSFDIGCFQINYKWHSTAFRSIDEMFDPNSNALYAAQFLTELYAEFDSWPAAVGAFHSRSPDKAKPYVARFERIRASLPTAPTPGHGPMGISLLAVQRRALTEPEGTSDPMVTARSPGSLVLLRQVKSRGNRVFIAMNEVRN
jgi:Transglycosylase SLT domain